MLKRIDRRLLTIFLIVFVGVTGGSMILPLLPLYARSEFTMSDEVVTLLFSSFFLAQFIAGPFLGRLSDIHGRLPLLIISQIGTVISFVMMALAPSVGWLFFARILDGITGGNIIVAQAYITDITPPKRRTEALGYVFMAFGAGFIIGPAVGGFLTSAMDVHAPFYVAAVAAALTVLLTWFALDESLTPEQRTANHSKKTASLSPQQIMHNTPLMLVLAIGFGVQLCLSVIQSTFALFGEDVLFAGSTAQQASLGVGLLLSVSGIAQVITQLFILKWLLRITSEGQLVIIGNILRGVGTLLLIMATAPWMAIPAMIMFAMGGGLAMPALQSLATETVPDELRGGVLGVYQSGASLSTIIGSAASGSVYAVSPPLPLGLSGGLSIFLVLPTLYLMRRRKPETSIEQPAV